jgi:hypothetical protein
MIANQVLKSVGTGYLLLPDRILTARHVLFRDTEAVDERRAFNVVTREGAQSEGAEWAEATCIWSDPSNDLALLQALKPTDLGSGIPPA